MVELRIVPHYVSDPEDDIEINSTKSYKQRKVKRTRNWFLENTYYNKQAAMDFINNEKTWSYHYNNMTQDGNKTYFRCNKAKLRGNQCPAAIYLLYDIRNEYVILFRNEDSHEHENLQTSNRLSDELKAEIKTFYDLKIKPKTIFAKLREKGVQFKKAQISNYISQLKQSLYGHTKISLGELEQWCIDHSTLPDDEDKAFVPNFYINYADDDEDEDEKEFRIFVTTKRLLRIAKKSSKIHADATYKLVWEGMPVLMIGTTDMDRHFHPFGIGVCTNERTADFAFIFKSIFQSLGESITVDTLVSDASDAIRNAFKQVFGEEVLLIMCWVHMRRNVAKNLHLVDAEFRDDLMDDIDTLQLASNKDVFDKGKYIFIKKWLSKKQKQFIDYMKNMWLSTHQNWYEGVASHTASQNNALESHNLVIKKEDTFRERMPLSRFLQQCLDSAGKWSKQYANKDKEFMETATIKLEQWTDGYHWAKSSKIVTCKILQNSVEYYCPAGEQTKVTEAQINIVKEMQWNTFEQFKKRAFAVWILTLPNDDDMTMKWNEGKCTCPCYLKKYMCKHIIGISIRLNYIKPPPAARQVPIGQKRNRGRPKKASKALIID